MIDNVLPVPAEHQQLVHDQQEQDEELEVVVDIDTLQHRQTVLATATGNGAQKVNLGQPFFCAPRRAGASDSWHSLCTWTEPAVLAVRKVYCFI